MGPKGLGSTGPQTCQVSHKDLMEEIQSLGFRGYIGEISGLYNGKDNGNHCSILVVGFPCTCNPNYLQLFGSYLLSKWEVRLYCRQLGFRVGIKVLSG